MPPGGVFRTCQTSKMELLSKMLSAERVWHGSEYISEAAAGGVL